MPSLRHDVALTVTLVLVAGCGTAGSGSSGGGAGASAPPQSSATSDGAASFVGRAANAIVLVQWTKAGGSVSGSLQQAVLPQQPGLPVNTANAAFTGTINGNGLTLDLNQGLGSTTALVGTIGGPGFEITNYPGAAAGSVISLDFMPGQASDYDQGVDNLTVSQFSSPCTLYAQSHDAQLTISGPDAATDCATFTQAIYSQTPWTTAPGSTSSSYLSHVCTLAGRSDSVAVTDDGGQTYGQQACSMLESEGWIASGGGTATASGGAGAAGSAAAGAAQCDPNISVTAASCAFAEKVFVAYAANYQANGAQSTATITATSPDGGSTHTLGCTLVDASVVCADPSAAVYFPLHAVEVYAPR